MSNGSLFLLITNEFAQKTLDSIPFPIRFSIPEFTHSDDFSLGEAGIEMVGEPGTRRSYKATEAASDSDDDINKTAVLLRNGATEADDEDIEIFNAYKVEVENTSQPQIKPRLFGRMKKALLVPFKKIISVELVWIKMEVDKPGFMLGDPIQINDMVVRIQVRFKACSKMFGKKLVKTFTTEQINLEARQLQLDLQTVGAKVKVLPSFTDVDVALSFSMLGLTFSSQPGITSIVNRQLHKRGAIEILDLSSFEKDIPFGGGRVGVGSIEFVPDPKGLVINMIMSIA